jgi:DNA-binding MarR family transcriptional regulator
LDRLQRQIDELRARLSAGTETAILSDPEAAATAELVRDILRMRRGREAVFGRELFGEPAWDLLLELYAAEVMHRHMSVSDACEASAVPATTALRWIQKLEKDGWVKRQADPFDGRRFWISLTERGTTAMRSYLSEVAVRSI